MGITWQLPAYTRLRFALVGAGGGIPDLRKGLDIRPGDVVISQPDQTYGGVVHCNLVKNVGDDHKGYSRLGAILSTSTLCKSGTDGMILREIARIRTLAFNMA